MANPKNNLESALNLTSMVEQVKDLPPMPALMMKALEISMDPDASVRSLQQVISRDQALSAKILRIVNSAMYALRREVSTVSHAVAVLGLNTVKSVIMAASVEHVFQNSRDLGAKLMSDHSWGAALAARAIARQVHYPNPEEALICGLMHDIGKPVLMQNVGRRYTAIISAVYRGESSFHELELTEFGYSHSHVGALLARKWNFPPQLAEAVGYHHDPFLAPDYKELACIANLADLFMISLEIGFEKNKDLVLGEQASAVHLHLDAPTLAALALEISMAIHATVAIWR
jgi:putative nucleotidyltransferase with HDIG domain